MARKFLYVVAALIVLFLAGLLALRLFPQQLSQWAFVPSGEFEQQATLDENAYQDADMWFSRPGGTGEDLARWQPAYSDDQSAIPSPAEQAVRPFAVFFVHPTSYMDKASWNAPLDDAEANRVAKVFIRGMASPFNQATEIWAPRYRQATLGAFMTDRPEGQMAFDAAYADVAQAFDYFVAQVDPEMPILLAGHSQGSMHLLRLLNERVTDQPLKDRIVAIYAVGWPVSVAHDLPALGFPACMTPTQSGCLLSWMTYAEPADPSPMLETYSASEGFDGQLRGASPILCTIPLTGGAGDAAQAGLNLGTLVPEDDLSGGELLRGAVPARCDERGILLIGDPPEMGRYVLPGNNYHVYDIPLFWANVQVDVRQRVSAWATTR